MEKAKDVFQYALGAIIIVGFFALMIILAAREIPTENKDLLNLVVGALIGSFATIVSYFYGSSKGSSDKNEMLKSK